MSRRISRNPLAGLLLLALLAVMGVACSGRDRSALPDCPDAARTCPASGSPATSPSAGPPTADGRATGSPAASASPTAKPTATAGAGSPSGTPAAKAACASFSACGFPDASTTGPRIPLTPHNTGYMAVRENGLVIRGWDITGSLDIYANDVTVIDSKITSDSWWGINLRPGFSGLRVLHSTITAVPGKGPDNGGVDYAVSNMGAAPSRSAGATSRCSATRCPWGRATCTTTTCTTSSRS